MSSVNIGIDIFGGDNAPNSNIEGVKDFLANHHDLSDSCTLFLFGESAIIQKELGKELCAKSYIQLIDCTEVISYNDHPVKAFLSKKESSIVKGFGYLKAGKIDVFSSAGNTGAMLVGATQVIGKIDGVIRPVISTILPREKGTDGVILDVGLNVDCKPEVLNQFAILGSIYSEFVYGVENPKVGLLNIGEEEEKGSVLTKATFQLLKQNERINFYGNIESREVLEDLADVVICDGFSGNVILKLIESFHHLAEKRNIKDAYIERFNYENYGGTPILGVESNVIIAHGISNGKAISNLLKLSYDITKSNLPAKIKAAFSGE